MDSRFSARTTLAALTLSACVAVSGCATQRAGSTGSGASTPQPATPGGRVVKSQDGSFDGKIVGTPAAGSKSPSSRSA